MHVTDVANNYLHSKQEQTTCSSAISKDTVWVTAHRLVRIHLQVGLM